VTRFVVGLVLGMFLAGSVAIASDRRLEAECRGMVEALGILRRWEATQHGDMP
jgi:hypothetical protein